MWLSLAAIASIVYGGLLVIAPMIGARVLTWRIGAYALIFGIALIAFGSGFAPSSNRVRW